MTRARMLLPLSRAANTARRTYRMKKDPVGYARSIGVRIGRDCRLLGLTAATFGSEPYLVRLGDHVTVTSGVRMITHDGGVWVFRQQEPDLEVMAPIVIGSNVFIGVNAVVLPGVTVGDDVVIGAGSVVTTDVPSRSVAAGVPARVLCSVEEYRRRVERRELHLRSLPEADKRRALIQQFAPVLNHNSRVKRRSS